MIIIDTPLPNIKNYSRCILFWGVGGPFSGEDRGPQIAIVQGDHGVP